MKKPNQVIAGTGYRWGVVRLSAVFVVLTMVTALSGCGGVVSNPFASRQFIATPYPHDFAIVIDTNSDSYFARTRVHQVIRASVMKSTTTYTNYSDYNNSVTSRYRRVTPLTRSQLQAMWNAVRQAHLLRGAFTWTYWHSRIDRYQRKSMTLQIRAGGREKSYYQLNHWDNNKLTLVLLCESVDLPIGQNVHPLLPPVAAPKIVQPPVRGSAKPIAPAMDHAMPQTAPAATGLPDTVASQHSAAAPKTATAVTAPEPVKPSGTPLLLPSSRAVKP